MPTVRWDGDDIPESQDVSGFADHTLGPGGAIRKGYYRGSLTRGLVAYYPFDGDVNDYALSNDGTNNGATWNGSGKIGSNSLWFDGSNYYVDCGNNSLLKPSTFTYAAWVKFDDNSTDNRMVSCLDSNSYGVGLFQRGDDTQNEIKLITGNGSFNNVFSNTVPNNGVWYHIAGTYDGDMGRIYIDGVPEGEGEFGYSTGSNPLWIGKDPAYDPAHTGSIDDVRVYDRALSTPEVSALASLTEPSIVTDEDTLI